MKQLIIYLLFAFCLIFYIDANATEDGLYLELDLTYYLENFSSNSIDWVGDSPGFRGDIYYRWYTNPWYLPDKCGYSHQSNILNGPPFNDESENTIDQLYCGKIWKIL